VNSKMGKKNKKRNPRSLAQNTQTGVVLGELVSLEAFSSLTYERKRRVEEEQERTAAACCTVSKSTKPTGL
jgi:hypothetical protein